MLKLREWVNKLANIDQVSNKYVHPNERAHFSL